MTPDATGTLTLTEFLLARIAEDEERYRETAGDERHQRWAMEESADYNEGYIVSEALHMLAECEAKRRIVRHEIEVRRYPDSPHLHALAAIYSSHTDYRDEWRP